MKTKHILLISTTVILLIPLAAGLVQAQGPAGGQPQAPLGSAFTYQGRLKDGGGTPIDDTCDLTFTLWDAESDGSQVGGDSVVTGVTVADGYFAATVNNGGEFGAGAFSGEARWMEIAVQCTGDAGPVTLSPRQPLSAAPQTLYALSTGALQGYPINTTAPAKGQVLKWSGAAWAPGTDETGGGGSGDITAVYASTGLEGGGDTGDVTLAVEVPYRLPQTCANGQIAEWTGTRWACGDDDVGEGGGGGDITAVYAGDGLLGGGDTGAVTLYADYGGSGSATTVSRSDHDHWGQVWSGSGFGLVLQGGENGLEATASTRGVQGEATATNGWGVYGYASATSGTTYGVFGQTSSTEGYGVYGRSLTGGGETAGVCGFANSLDGYGVYGEAPNYGLYGYASSTVGHGVYGEATRYGVYGLSGAASGTTYGMYGQADSTSGRGVYGYASAVDGTTYGVYGEAESPNGRGVRGYNGATGGGGIGVSGGTNSTDGYGVYGLAGATSGTSYGVYGRSNSPAGYGVYGQGGYGVYGSSSGDDGHGVHGYASDADGNTSGVYGEAASTYGNGVYGLASNTVGAGYGVYGRSSSQIGGCGVYGYAVGTSAYGLYGWATHGSGTNYGVYGRTESPNGFAGYFNGRFYSRASINSTAHPTNHAGQIYNSSGGTSPDVLALKVGYTGNPSDASNFITFFNGDNDALGSVEGDGGGGVTYKSGSGDYAEFLPRLDPQEAIEPGDVVGVFDGQVTRSTQGAGQVLVVSSRPIVLGNDPGEGNAEAYEKVAFLGQVAVKVRGPVTAGDLLVPSGLEDGTAVAVAPEAITPAQFAQLVGVAWETSAVPGLRTVLAAVGLVQHDPTVARMAGRIQELEGSIDGLEARLAALEGAAPDTSAPASSHLSGLLPGAGLLLAGVAGAWLLRSKGGGR